ncbi:hypothetical protein EBQ91_07015, partial [bacterium]|nr:hypothetical protein [bacterium]
DGDALAAMLKTLKGKIDVKDVNTINQIEFSCTLSTMNNKISEVSILNAVLSSDRQLVNKMIKGERHFNELNDKIIRDTAKGYVALAIKTALNVSTFLLLMVPVVNVVVSFYNRRSIKRTVAMHQILLDSKIRELKALSQSTPLDQFFINHQANIGKVGFDLKKELINTIGLEAANSLTEDQKNLIKEIAVLAYDRDKARNNLMIAHGIFLGSLLSTGLSLIPGAQFIAVTFAIFNAIAASALPIFRVVDETLFHNRISDFLNATHKYFIGEKVDDLLSTNDIIRFRAEIDALKEQKSLFSTVKDNLRAAIGLSPSYHSVNTEKRIDDGIDQANRMSCGQSLFSGKAKDCIKINSNDNTITPPKK